MSSYSEADYRAAMALVESGLSDYHTAKRTGINRGTIRRWRLSESAPRSVVRDRLATSWRIRDPAAYCYLLGVYLGDGTVCAPARGGPWMQVVNDRRYTSISEEILDAMGATFPGARPRQHRSFIGESDVLCISHPAIGAAFPQHGPGRKHHRPIALAAWQRDLTHTHPGALIRGLIHSDGCRVENRFQTKLPSGRIAHYRYVRYFFSNHSRDIRDIFIEHCDVLGVRVTQSNHRNLSISHRASVAVLENIVGPKS